MLLEIEWEGGDMDRIEEIRKSIESGRVLGTLDEIKYLLSALEEKDREIDTLKTTYNQLFDVCKNEQQRAEQAEARCEELEAYGYEVIELQRNLVVANERITELEKDKSILTEKELTSIEIFKRNASLIARIFDLESRLSAAEKKIDDDDAIISYLRSVLEDGEGGKK